MLTREQRRKIQELAYNTYKRNYAIRFLYHAGVKQVLIRKANQMTKQRVSQIIKE